MKNMKPYELFTKAQRTLVNPHEFDIHRKLREAKVVYVSFARGGGKPETTRRKIEKLIATGMDVRAIRPADRITVKAIESMMLDKDILSQARLKRADELINGFMADFIHEDLEHNFKPIIRSDAYMHDIPWQHFLYQACFGNRGFITQEEED